MSSSDWTALVLQAYTVMHHVVYQQTHLLYNRHLDQILLSALYGVCKVNQLRLVSFQGNHCPLQAAAPVQVRHFPQCLHLPITWPTIQGKHWHMVTLPLNADPLYAQLQMQNLDSLVACKHRNICRKHTGCSVKCRDTRCCDPLAITAIHWLP